MKLSNIANNIHPARVLPFWFMSLDRSTNRFGFQIQQSIKEKLILNKVSAFTPGDFEFIAYRKKLGFNNSRVEDALVYSAYKLLQGALKSNDEILIISEDDAQFCYKFREKLYLKLIESQLECDVLHLGSRGLKHLHKCHENFYPDWPIYRKWKKGEPLYPGAPVCFLTSRAGLTKLFDAFKDFIHNEDWVPLDVLLAKLYMGEKYGLTARILSENLCKEGSFRSDREDISKINFDN